MNNHEEGPKGSEETSQKMQTNKGKSKVRPEGLEPCPNCRAKFPRKEKTNPETEAGQFLEESSMAMDVSTVTPARDVSEDFMVMSIDSACINVADETEDPCYREKRLMQESTAADFTEGTSSNARCYNLCTQHFETITAPNKKTSPRIDLNKPTLSEASKKALTSVYGPSGSLDLLGYDDVTMIQSPESDGHMDSD